MLILPGKTSSWAAASGDVATFLTSDLDDAVATNYTFTYDVGSFSVGEKLILFAGSTEPPTEAEFNTNAVTAETDTWNEGSSGRQGAVYEYTLVSGDISTGTITIGVTFATNRPWCMQALLHSASGSVVVSTKQSSDNNTTTYNVTPTATPYSIFQFHQGQDERFVTGNGGLTYSAGPSARLFNASGTTGGGSGGIVHGTSAGAVTITFAYDAAAAGAGAHVAYSIE